MVFWITAATSTSGTMVGAVLTHVFVLHTSPAPAIVLGLTPHLAAWCKTLMDGALGAAGTSAAAIGMEKLGNVGVLYEGLSIMGGGAILSGLVLAAIAFRFWM